MSWPCRQPWKRPEPTLGELGTASSDGLDMLLTWLSDDFYLQQRADGGYAFKSRWLRDWWERYHGGR